MKLKFEPSFKSLAIMCCKWCLMVLIGIMALTKVDGQTGDTVQSSDPYQWSSKVQETHGLDWFILAKPLRDYKVLTTFEMTYPEAYTPSLNIKQIGNILKHKSRSLVREYPEADGYWLAEGATVKVIRYTDDAERHTRIANVKTLEGKQVYLWSEALKVNEKAFDVPYDGGLPLSNNYLEAGLARLVKKAKQQASDGQTFDALLIKGTEVKAIRYLNVD